MRVRLKLEQLHDLIARSNLTQNHWAIKLGLSRGHWSNIVNGKHPYPSARTRERLLEVFGADFDDLFEVESGPAGWSDQDFQAAVSDRYIIDREVGQGGMGTVYLARDVKHGRQVAIKVVSPEAVSGIGVNQFLKEIRYSARLQHPHILPLYDSDVAAGYPFYVTPYLRDGSLRDRLRRERQLSLETTLTIARGVAAALHYAHEYHVLHCDVKPENILLFDDHAFVADFGISRAVHAEFFEWERQPELDSSAGTPAYVSPEQATGERNLDGRSDVYSFGCMVFEMLSGRPPFVGTNTMQIVAQRFTSVVPDLHDAVPHLPRRLSDCVSKAMALTSQRRYPTAAAFYEALGDTREPVSRSGTVATSIASRLGDWGQRLIGRAPVNRLIRGRTRLMLSSIKQDLAYALRSLRRAPGFATIVALTLAFGIGANALVFSLMNPYFIRALPFGDADRLVQVEQIHRPTGSLSRVSLPQYLDWQARSQAFEALGVYAYTFRNITGEGGPQRTMVGLMTANMFAVLEAPAAIGRALLPEDGQPGAPLVTVLRHGLWQDRFGSDPTVVGRTLIIDGAPHTIVGIMPPRFNFPYGEIQLWTPIRDVTDTADRDNNSYLPIGRLAAGWTASRARDELLGIQRDLSAQFPRTDGEFAGISVRPLREALNFAYDVLWLTFTLLLAAVLFALVIACVNVASLSLARATARTGEMAVRAALGAGRGRLVRQLVTESVVLAVIGGGLGVAVAVLGSRFIGPVIPEALFRIGEASLDTNVLLFTLLVTLVAPVVFGLAPAVSATRTDLAAALKEGGRGGWGRRSMRARRILVVFEVAMAVLLLGGMGLMGRSLFAIRGVDLGFGSDRILTVEVTPPAAAYPERKHLESYFDRALAEIAALPGVRGASTAAVLPLNHEHWGTRFAGAGREPTSADGWPTGLRKRVGPDYFRVMSIPLLAGRAIERGDEEGAPPVVVINRTLATSLWPNEEPVGQTLVFGDPTDPLRATVVGVVGDVKHDGLDQPVLPTLYRSMAQTMTRRRFIVVASDGPPEALSTPVRRALLDLDANLPVTIQPMNAIVAENTLQWGLSAIFLSVIAGAALLLASLGIYGVIAYSAAQRQTEIGLRMALGATSQTIRRTFVTEGVRLCAIGLAIGLVLSIVGGQVMSSLLFGVSPFDPITLGAVLAVFTLVAMTASLLPALRASRIDPVRALRRE